MLYVFKGIDQLPDDFIGTCSCFLPKWRLDQMMVYRLPSDRKLCALAYLILVYALKKEGVFYALPEFGYRTEGKPFLSNYQDIYFNLSHCRNVVVCILSDREVGVDVETVFPYDDALAKAVCSDPEYLRVSWSSDPNIQAKNFTELWTRKESVVKWRGTGLNCDPREILQDNSPDIPGQGYQISSHYIKTGDFYISICRNSP